MADKEGKSSFAGAKAASEGVLSSTFPPAAREDSAFICPLFTAHKTAASILLLAEKYDILVLGPQSIFLTLCHFCACTLGATPNTKNTQNTPKNFFIYL